MASSLARGLFARAIGESGAMIAPIAPMPLAQAQQQGTAFAEKAGAATLAELRALPATAVLQAGDGLRFRPVLDGWLLDESPAATFARGAQASVPLLLGANRSEEHTSELQSLMRNSYAVFCLK